MATLLRGPEWGWRARGRADMTGRLDPLTLAVYRWRVASDAYDAPAVLDALANRFATESRASESFDGVE